MFYKSDGTVVAVGGDRENFDYGQCIMESK